MASTTIELPDDVLAQVQDLAQSTNRRVEEVLAEAVRQGLAYDRWFRAQADESLRATQSGHVASPEEVGAMANHVLSNRQRMLGLNQGAITTTADFDAPLPDEFWLGGA